jgi:hypothetical protein
MNILSRTKLFLGTSEAYLPILKAGYVLIAAALVAVSQFGPELIKQENETFKGMYEMALRGFQWDPVLAGLKFAQGERQVK